ncbi:hypothetical protein BD770DRAFT_407321 [Pilaira anomala]|nr:hypothetical protein BD770DRAFT_407321 [Pilaira anomala]
MISIDLYAMRSYKKFLQVGIKQEQEDTAVVHQAYDSTLNMQVALKTEKLSANRPRLSLKRELYNLVNVVPGFPTNYDFFEDSSNRYMTMTLLGESIEAKLRKCNNRMNLKSILMVADPLRRQTRKLVIFGLEYEHCSYLVYFGLVNKIGETEGRTLTFCK